MGVIVSISLLVLLPTEVPVIVSGVAVKIVELLILPIGVPVRVIGLPLIDGVRVRELVDVLETVLDPIVSLAVIDVLEVMEAVMLELLVKEVSVKVPTGLVVKEDAEVPVKVIGLPERVVVILL